MKLTLRDLFWLVLVVAMGCAWWLDRRQQVRRAELLLQAAQDAGWVEMEFDGRPTFARVIERVPQKRVP